MKTILLWCVTLFLWLAHQYFESINIKISYVDSYLDDVLFIPLVMGFALVIQRLIVRDGKHFVFDSWLILIVWMYVSVVFEWILPRYYPYTADWRDVFAYGAGALIFKFCLNTKSAAAKKYT